MTELERFIQREIAEELLVPKEVKSGNRKTPLSQEEYIALMESKGFHFDPERLHEFAQHRSRSFNQLLLGMIIGAGVSFIGIQFSLWYPLGTIISCLGLAILIITLVSELRSIATVKERSFLAD